jgi:uncharacterized protein (TIGR02266 family)
MDRMLGRKILLAKDPELISAMKDSFLYRGGYSLLSATDGLQAFEMIEEEDPALVLLDLNMTGLEGDACCRKVKEDPLLCSTPVVLILRPDQQKGLDRCRKAGCDEILYRPIDPHRLITTVCLLLNIVDRAAPRIVTRVPIRFGPVEGKRCPGHILNLNGGGLFIAADRLFPMDTPLELEISLPRCSVLLRCRGQVAWVNHPEWIKAPNLPSGMGVRFCELKSDQVEEIRNFVEEQSGGNS